MIAFDFDLTIVNVHTGGHWSGLPSELARHVRPEMKCVMEESMRQGIHVSVASFSVQEQLIKEGNLLIFSMLCKTRSLVNR